MKDTPGSAEKVRDSVIPLSPGCLRESPHRAGDYREGQGDSVSEVHDQPSATCLLSRWEGISPGYYTLCGYSQ